MKKRCTDTHFRCEKMGNAVISVLVCLKRQKEKGFVPYTHLIPDRKKWIEYTHCLKCKKGQEIKQMIVNLL